jgi:hypothetical protein
MQNIINLKSGLINEFKTFEKFLKLYATLSN